jgi:hypothetical protein
MEASAETAAMETSTMKASTTVETATAMEASAAMATTTAVTATAATHLDQIIRHVFRGGGSCRTEQRGSLRLAYRGCERHKPCDSEET